MHLYPVWSEGWNVETLHPIEETEEGPICTSCLDAVQPTINFAADWGSTAHQAQFTDADAETHTVVVRQIDA